MKNKLIKELEKCYSPKQKKFYASIDHLANDIYIVLKKDVNEIKQLKEALKLEQQLSENTIVKYRQALRDIMQISTDEIKEKYKEILGEN